MYIINCSCASKSAFIDQGATLRAIRCSSTIKRFNVNKMYGYNLMILRQELQNIKSMYIKHFA